jgi:alkaline phosphatase D
MARLSRRSFVASSLAVAAGCSQRSPSPAIVHDRPTIPFGVASGDVTANSGIVWSRCDRPGRMTVEWSTVESLKDAQRGPSIDATPDNDLTAKVDLTGLPPNQRIFYRVQFMDLANPRAVSEPVTGTFKTAPLAAAGPIRFAWSGDVAGQGWGIDLARGGMTAFETMRSMNPDFFLHAGDTIYADQEIKPEVKLPDGTVWRNVTTPAKSKVAETLAEFRGNFQYNLLDENVRRFNASIPTIAQWDDHEVLNNWWPGRILQGDPRYSVLDCNVLAERAKRAFLEYMPIRIAPADPTRIFRSYAYGPLLDVIMLDARSYKAPNGENRQPQSSEATVFLGNPQLEWVKRKLKESTALWKVIGSEMPIGMRVGDNLGAEGYANGAGGGPLGREHEIAGLLKFIKDNGIQNVVWLCADIHYACAIEYHPDRAAFKEFLPFWEFTSGPLHAGSFGPSGLDNTFGPKYAWHSCKQDGYKSGLGPAAGFQYFGLVDIEPRAGALTISQFNAAGGKLYSQTLTPVGGVPA